MATGTCVARSSKSSRTLAIPTCCSGAYDRICEAARPMLEEAIAADEAAAAEAGDAADPQE